MRKFFLNFIARFSVLILVFASPISTYFAYQNTDSFFEKKEQLILSELDKIIQVTQNKEQLNSLVNEFNLNYKQYFTFKIESQTNDSASIQKEIKEGFISVFENKNAYRLMIFNELLMIMGMILSTIFISILMVYISLLRPIIKSIKQVNNEIDDLFSKDDCIELLDIHKRFEGNIFKDLLIRVFQKVTLEIQSLKDDVRTKHIEDLSSKITESSQDKDFILSISNLFYLIKLNPHSHEEIMKLADQGINFTNRHINKNVVRKDQTDLEIDTENKSVNF